MLDCELYDGFGILLFELIKEISIFASANESFLASILLSGCGFDACSCLIKERKLIPRLSSPLFFLQSVLIKSKTLSLCKNEVKNS